MLCFLEKKLVARSFVCMLFVFYSYNAQSAEATPFANSSGSDIESKEQQLEQKFQQVDSLEAQIADAATDEQRNALQQQKQSLLDDIKVAMDDYRNSLNDNSGNPSVNIPTDNSAEDYNDDEYVDFEPMDSDDIDDWNDNYNDKENSSSYGIRDAFNDLQSSIGDALSNFRSNVLPTSNENQTASDDVSQIFDDAQSEDAMGKDLAEYDKAFDASKNSNDYDQNFNADNGDSVVKTAGQISSESSWAVNDNGKVQGAQIKTLAEKPLDEDAWKVEQSAAFQDPDGNEKEFAKSFSIPATE